MGRVVITDRSAPNSDNGTPVVDFGELAKSGVRGEGLEKLVRMLAKKLVLEVSWSGRGPDGGRDLIVIEKFDGELSSHRVKWLVSCKDYHGSGRSVREDDVGSVTDKVKQHKADGFLLVTTTTVSSGLKQKLDELDKRGGGEILTQVWDSAELSARILRKDCEDVFQQFFPKSYRQLRDLGNVDDALKVLKTSLPAHAYERLVRLAIPYLESGFDFSSSDIVHLTSEQAHQIDVIIQALVEKEDMIGAVNLTQNLEEDVFISFVMALDERDYDMCEKYLEAVIQQSKSKDTILNAYQYLVENHELRHTERMFLATFLDENGLQIALADQVAEWLQDELVQNATSYDFWSDLDELSTQTVIHYVEVEEVDFDPIERKSIHFSGTLAFNLELRHGSQRDGVYSNVSIPGNFKGFIDPEHDEWSLRDVSVDTSSYYE